MIEELQEKVRHTTPIPLNLSEVAGVDYQQVSFSGEFDSGKEVLIGPRSFIDARGEQGGGGIISARDSKVGFLVVSPFTLTTGERILINRGWISNKRNDIKSKLERQVSGIASLSGVLRLTEERSSLTPQNDVQKEVWYSRDVEALAEKFGTLPIFIDLDLESSKEAAMKGGPIGGQTRIALRNDHVQYMLTWWTVSALTFILWIMKFVL